VDAINAYLGTGSVVAGQGVIKESQVATPKAARRLLPAGRARHYRRDRRVVAGGSMYDGLGWGDSSQPPPGP